MVTVQASRLPLAAQLRAERMEPALAPRTIALANAPYQAFLHAIVLTHGQIAVDLGHDAEFDLDGPGLLIVPPNRVRRLRLPAGDRAIIIGCGPEMLREAIGEQPESLALRRFLEETSHQGELADTDHRRIERIAQGLAEEIETLPVAAPLVLPGYFRLLFVTAWRLAGAEPAQEPLRGANDTLQRFRQLVEVEFRRHRPISYYAEQLGLTTDRLHALCQRSLGRPPLTLVHERLAQEARRRLERSDQSIKSLSHSLGFRDPAHFSRFFKARIGLSPALYRDSLTRNTRAGNEGTARDYHDWP